MTGVTLINDCYHAMSMNLMETQGVDAQRTLSEPEFIELKN